MYKGQDNKMDKMPRQDGLVNPPSCLIEAILDKD